MRKHNRHNLFYSLILIFLLGITGSCSNNTSSANIISRGDQTQENKQTIHRTLENIKTIDNQRALLSSKIIPPQKTSNIKSLSRNNDILQCKTYYNLPKSPVSKRKSTDSKSKLDDLKEENCQDQKMNQTDTQQKKSSNSKKNKHQSIIYKTKEAGFGLGITRTTTAIVIIALFLILTTRSQTFILAAGGLVIIYSLLIFTLGILAFAW